MQPVPQDLMKAYVQSQHFNSTAEIMEAMKEMFWDVIQTAMDLFYSSKYATSFYNARIIANT